METFQGWEGLGLSVVGGVWTDGGSNSAIFILATLPNKGQLLMEKREKEFLSEHILI